MKYQNLFNANIGLTFKQAIKLFAGTPKSAAAMLRVSAHEAKAAKLRKRWLEQGVSVPPLLIVSTTEACNLCCKECYAANVCREPGKELSAERIAGILDEASAAGCSMVFLAGGEPLLSPDWLQAAAKRPELLGLVFTNGTLFDEGWFSFFDSHRNLIALFSVEGLPQRTDERRGSGVTATIKAAMAEMKKRRIPFGISVTTGSHNLDEVLSDTFFEPYIELGCSIVIHVEYVPMGTSEAFSPLSAEGKARLSAVCGARSKEGKAIVFPFPGDEDQYGGCLAAGRGFLHITSSGSLEPCPFAPYSDRSLAELSLIEALRSPLLKAIRAEAHTLREGVGGCSLRGKEEYPRLPGVSRIMIRS